MASNDQLPQSIARLDDVPLAGMGAPSPTIVGDEQGVSLCYYIEPTQGRRDDVAVVYFDSVLDMAFGPPDENEILEHPLFDLGIDESSGECSGFEVINSEWCARLGYSSRVRHFFFPFHDSTFQALAMRYSVRVLRDSSVLKACSGEIRRWTGESLSQSNES